MNICSLLRHQVISTVKVFRLPIHCLIFMFYICCLKSLMLIVRNYSMSIISGKGKIVVFRERYSPYFCSYVAVMSKIRYSIYVRLSRDVNFYEFYQWSTSICQEQLIFAWWVKYLQLIMTIQEKRADFWFVLGKDTSTFCTCCSIWNDWGLFEYISISYCPSNILQAWQILPSEGFPKQTWELDRRHPVTAEPWGKNNCIRIQKLCIRR